MITYAASAVALMLNIAWLAGAYASESEAAFKDASSYTVEVRTVIEAAFVPDEYGAQSGAGFLIDRSRGWLLTNAHVVGASPSTVRAAFKNHDFNEVEKLYVDPFLDVAVVTLPAQAIPANVREAQPDCDEIPSVGHPVGPLRRTGICFS